MSFGGYDDLAQACLGITDDVITFRTIAGSVEVGLDEEGSDDIERELRERARLAPAQLRYAYREVAIALAAVPTQRPESTPGVSGSQTPRPTDSTSTPGPSLTPTTSPEAALVAVVEARTDVLTDWLTRWCSGQ